METTMVQMDTLAWADGEGKATGARPGSTRSAKRPRPGRLTARCSRGRDDLHKQGTREGVMVGESVPEVRALILPGLRGGLVRKTW